MPCVYASFKVGVITNKVRNIARLTITAFGGLVCSPIAVRSSDNTTAILVKQVIMIRIDGARLRIVISATICIMRSVNMPPPDRSIDIELEPAAALAGPAASATSGIRSSAEKSARTIAILFTRTPPRNVVQVREDRSTRSRATLSSRPAA